MLVLVLDPELDEDVGDDDEAGAGSDDVRGGDADTCCDGSCHNLTPYWASG